MKELKVVTWIPPLSRPKTLGWKRASRARNRSLPMVMTWSLGSSYDFFKLELWKAVWISCSKSRQHSRVSPWYHARSHARRWWSRSSHVQPRSSSSNRSSHVQPCRHERWRGAERNPCRWASRGWLHHQNPTRYQSCDQKRKGKGLDISNILKRIKRWWS